MVASVVVRVSDIRFAIWKCHDMMPTSYRRSSEKAYIEQKKGSQDRGGEKRPCGGRLVWPSGIRDKRWDTNSFVLSGCYIHTDGNSLPSRGPALVRLHFLWGRYISVLCESLKMKYRVLSWCGAQIFGLKLGDTSGKESVQVGGRADNGWVSKGRQCYKTSMTQRIRHYQHGWWDQ